MSVTHKKYKSWHNGTWILPRIQPEICGFWLLNIKLGKIYPHQSHRHKKKKTQLKPKFEVCSSKNTDFGIMVLGFYLGFDL